MFVSIPSLSGLRVIVRFAVERRTAITFQSPLYRVSESFVTADNMNFTLSRFNPLFIGSPSHYNSLGIWQLRKVSIPSLSGLRVIGGAGKTTTAINVSIPSLSGLRVIERSSKMIILNEFQSPLYRVSESLRHRYRYRPLRGLFQSPLYRVSESLFSLHASE